MPPRSALPQRLEIPKAPVVGRIQVKQQSQFRIAAVL